MLGKWLKAATIPSPSVPSQLYYISTNYGTTATIPTNVTDLGRGFLGLIWQTGFNSGAFNFPPDTVSPGWTKVAGVTKSSTGSLSWRSSIQYKILTPEELGSSVTMIPYTGGNSCRVSLFETGSNETISSVLAGSVNNNGNDDPPAQTITGSAASDVVALYLAMYYSFGTLPTRSFSGATPSQIIQGDTEHELRIYASSLSETSKPNVTVDQSSNAYSHLSSLYLAVS